MDFNKFTYDGMPIGVFFSNRYQKELPKTVKNVFVHKGKHWECDMCTEKFSLQSILMLQKHLDTVHGEENRD